MRESSPPSMRAGLEFGPALGLSARARRKMVDRLRRAHLAATYGPCWFYTVERQERAYERLVAAVRGEQGQALVEVALVLPVLVAIFLAITTGGRSFADRILAGNGVHAAAIAMVTGGDPTDAFTKAAPNLNGGDYKLTTSETPTTATACVDFGYSLNFLFASRQGAETLCATERKT